MAVISLPVGGGSAYLVDWMCDSHTSLHSARLQFEMVFAFLNVQVE